jgi:hypothetical protein
MKRSSMKQCSSVVAVTGMVTVATWAGETSAPEAPADLPFTMKITEVAHEKRPPYLWAGSGVIMDFAAPMVKIGDGFWSICANGDAPVVKRWRGIRTARWIYAYHFDGDWIIYDLENDPCQLKNLVDDPDFAAKKKELREQLEVMRKQLGESRPLEGKMPAPIRLPA